jgi:hypothetical protein
MRRTCATADVDRAELPESLKQTVRAEGINALAFIPLEQGAVLRISRLRGRKTGSLLPRYFMYMRRDGAVERAGAGSAGASV